MSEQQFRIPKVHVPIICHTVQGEHISGEIFLDMTLSEGYNTEQILEFFNAPPPFFPIRLPDASSILLLKESVVQVDIPQLLSQFKEHIYSFVAKKEAILHLQTLGPVRTTIVIDLPEEYSRILDFVNRGNDFVPVLIGETLALINLHHIYKIEL